MLSDALTKQKCIFKKKNFIKKEDKTFFRDLGWTLNNHQIPDGWYCSSILDTFGIHFPYFCPVFQHLLLFNWTAYLFQSFFPIPRLLKVINLEYSVKEKESQLNLVWLMRPFCRVFHLLVTVVTLMPVSSYQICSPISMGEV